MSLFLVDINAKSIEAAAESVKAVPGVGEVYSMVVDVGKIDQVVALREKVLDVFGEVCPSHSMDMARDFTDRMVRCTFCRTTLGWEDLHRHFQSTPL